jgi:desulfoferrodoxin (superoxide reductase-like protein)
MFFLASELGMTVGRLAHEMTQEELVGWAAYYQTKNEEDSKAMERAKRNSSASTMRTK